MIIYQFLINFEKLNPTHYVKRTRQKKGRQEEALENIERKEG